MKVIDELLASARAGREIAGPGGVLGYARRLGCGLRGGARSDRCSPAGGVARGSVRGGDGPASSASGGRSTTATGRVSRPTLTPTSVGVSRTKDHCDGCWRLDSPLRSRRTSTIRTITRSPIRWRAPAPWIRRKQSRDVPGSRSDWGGASDPWPSRAACSWGTRSGAISRIPAWAAREGCVDGPGGTGPGHGPRVGTRTPSSNDRTDAAPSCTARCPARAWTGGCSPARRAASTASTWRSNVSVNVRPRSLK